MFSRAYRAAITLPPLLWVALFLLLPYALLFCYSFWSVSPAQAIIHSWTLNNYRELFRVNVYLQTLFRSMWIAARVTIFSLLLGYPLDRKSTRLNSSHPSISYAVFCLKKKNNNS